MLVELSDDQLATIEAALTFHHHFNKTRLAMSDKHEDIIAIDAVLAALRTSQPAQGRYSHRNGETEPPTIVGRFWFMGSVGDISRRGEVRIVPYRNDLLFYVDWAEGWMPSDEFAGKWYGPIVPPWEQPQPDHAHE